MASVDLPWDITTEILSRLPVKSLMRFKCVSTSFFNLISNDPIFRKQHRHHHSRFKKVILVPRRCTESRLELAGLPYPVLYLSPEGDVRVGLNKVLGLPYLNISLNDCCGCDVFCKHRGFQRPYQDMYFHNICEGLFCMSIPGGGPAVIWNPTTRQTSRRIKSCLLPNLPYIYPRWIGYSLAHDSRSDVYKLLGLTISGHNTYKLYFYSTEMGMWMYIEESSPCDYVMYYGKTTIVNGAFHWLGSNEEKFRRPHVVVSLDISDETYGTLALPEAICDNSKGPKLCELKGKLCIFSQHIQDLHWDLWVMNEYGDVDSMMRMFRMPIVKLIDRYAQPFHMLEDDTLIVRQSTEFYSYKDGRKILHNTIFCRYGGLYVDPYVYFESLISPHIFLHAINHKIMGNDEHSSNTMPENEFSSKLVATNFSATTNRGKHVVAKKRWLKSSLQRLCFCKSF
ncbi:hypothetical protein CASFOL_003550 [Castilleja foliolosa]|uniref:F-box domain-containing protein n=1 Tax=Castilleja foliolosa TaxID=1961234 RepID=A0ABD3ELD9_9LAMI